jgi:hypothetical protein
MFLNLPLDDVLEMFFEVEVFVLDYGCNRIARLGIIRSSFGGVLLI